MKTVINRRYNIYHNLIPIKSVNPSEVFSRYIRNHISIIIPDGVISDKYLQE